MVNEPMKTLSQSTAMVGAKLRAKRKMMKKTIREMAIKSKISYQTLQKWESHPPAAPRAEIVQKIAKAYKIDPAELKVNEAQIGENETGDFSVYRLPKGGFLDRKFKTLKMVFESDCSKLKAKVYGALEEAEEIMERRRK